MTEPSTRRADLVLMDGRILTMTGRDHTVEAVAVTNGRIVALGTSSAIRTNVGPHTTVIDLHGRRVTPGLIDSHAHLATLASRDLFQIDLSYPGTKNVEGLLQKVRQAVEGSHEGAWVQGGGWVESNSLLNSSPTRADLDSVGPRNPIILTHSTGHFAVANSEALRLAGITRESVDPVAGIGRDAATREPTGALVEAPAMRLVQGLVPSRTTADWDRIIAHGQRRWLAEGVTAIKDNYALRDYYEIVGAFRRVDANAGPSLRSYIMCHVGTPEDVVRVAEHYPTPWSLAVGGFPKLGGVKAFMDGSLVARTAWVSEPFLQSSDTGAPAMAPETFAGIVREADSHDLQVGVHAIGDRAVDSVLDAFAAVGPRRSTARRFSIMHALLTTPMAIQRMREMDVIVETQSAFLPSLSVGYSRALDARRLHKMIPLRSLLQAGLTVTNGSDSPTAPPGPRYGMWAACTRPDSLEGDGAELYGGRETIDVYDALRMYTTMGSQAMEMEEYIGSLEQGKFADFVVWERDPLTIPSAELREARPDMTILDGRVVFGSS